MIPWPIAMLTLFYGVLAALSAASTWTIVTGASQRPLLVHLGWLALSGATTLGLPLLRPWGRRLAVWTSGALMAVLLAIAGLLVLAARQPVLGLATAVVAASQMIPIRYLQRPAVKAWFQQAR
jgi:hypothetical protein